MESEDNPPMLKRPRTSEDFYLFCTYILEHEDYERQKQEELRKQSASPMDSAGSLVSESNFSSGQEDNKPTDEDSDVDSESWDLVTCYCNKPFAGRAMIECTNCLTWVHLSCAKIRKTHIPDVFYCALCKAGGKSSDSSNSNSPNGEGTSNTPQPSSVQSAIGSPVLPPTTEIKDVKPSVESSDPPTKSNILNKTYQRLSQSSHNNAELAPSDTHTPETRRHMGQSHSHMTTQKGINHANAILKRTSSSS